MKENQHDVLCHSNVCKEDVDLLFFEEKTIFDSSGFVEGNDHLICGTKDRDELCKCPELNYPAFVDDSLNDQENEIETSTVKDDQSGCFHFNVRGTNEDDPLASDTGISSYNPKSEISPLRSPVNCKHQFASAAEFSLLDPNRSVIKCELHELTVSYEESNYNVIKDIYVDEGVHAVGIFSTESWTGDPTCLCASLPSDQEKNCAIQEVDDNKLLSEDHSKTKDVDSNVADECTTKGNDNIESLVPDYLKISSEDNANKGTAKGAFIEDLTTPFGSKCSTTKRVTNDAPEIEQFDRSSLKLESTYVQNSVLHSISDGNSCAQLSAQMTSEEAVSASCTTVVTTADKSIENISESVLDSEAMHSHKVDNSNKTSASPAIQVQCNNGVKCSDNSHGQLPELEDMPNTEDKTSEDLSLASKDQFTGGETSFSAAGSISGLVTCPGLVPYSGSISLRSDNSTTSTRSFAFPVLQPEWNGSPVRMAKAHNKRGWRKSLLCCRF